MINKSLKVIEFSDGEILALVKPLLKKVIPPTTSELPSNLTPANNKLYNFIQIDLGEHNIIFKKQFGNQNKRSPKLALMNSKLNESKPLWT